MQSVELERLEYVKGDERGQDLLNFISDDSESWPSRIVERSELERILTLAVERMPKIERTVLQLYYYEELNLREIAEVVGDAPLARGAIAGAGHPAAAQPSGAGLALESREKNMNPPARTVKVVPTLDVLLDVELPLMLRFGSTQMAFGEVMNLNTGSVIEFAGAAETPVELLVNGRVVARGEVVMVKGNYGVRIARIASRRERSIAVIEQNPENPTEE